MSKVYVTLELTKKEYIALLAITGNLVGGDGNLYAIYETLADVDEKLRKATFDATNGVPVIEGQPTVSALVEAGLL